MNLRKEITEIISELKRRREFKNQAQIADFLGYNVSYFSRVLNSDDIPIDFEEKFFKAFPKSKYLKNDDFLSHLPDPMPKENPTTKDALNNLKKIQAQKENRKPKNYDEGYYNEDDFVNTKRTVVTIKGFAGLQNAFFPDDYIDKHFTTEIVKVPKEDAGKHFYRIQVKENNYSMYPKIKPLDWTDCVEISKDEWNSPNIYKKDKVYCFWHPIKGILFKFAKLTNEDKIIELFSLNEDRIEYPNEKFNLLEFKKIMCVEYIIQKA